MAQFFREVGKCDGHLPFCCMRCCFPRDARTGAGVPRTKVLGGVITISIWHPCADPNFAFEWNKRVFRQVGLDPEKPPTTIAELDE